MLLQNLPLTTISLLGGMPTVSLMCVQQESILCVCVYWPTYICISLHSFLSLHRQTGFWQNLALPSWLFFINPPGMYHCRTFVQVLFLDFGTYLNSTEPVLPSPGDLFLRCFFPANHGDWSLYPIGEYEILTSFLKPMILSSPAVRIPLVSCCFLFVFFSTCLSCYRNNPSRFIRLFNFYCGVIFRESTPHKAFLSLLEKKWQFTSWNLSFYSVFMTDWLTSHWLSY